MIDPPRFMTFFNRWLLAKGIKPYQAHERIGIATQTAYDWSNGKTFPRQRKALELAKAMRLSKPRRLMLMRLLSLDRADHLAAKRRAR